ncbi:MAG: molybdopterin-dependent oxidoreductase, partial [Deltaproteobacteria bacterium]
MKRTLTVCPYCGTGCMFYLVSDNGRLVGVEPSTTHPVSRGGLCVKGWNAFAFVHHPDRLTTPMVRRDGVLQPACWEEAFSLVVERIQAVQGRHGADAFMFASSAKATNEENYLLMKLARAVFGTNNIDHCARLCHSSTVTGLAETFGSGAMTNSISCFDQADVIFVIGSNTTEQHPLIGSRILNAVQKGTRLVVADNRRIRLARQAELHLRHRNGSDVALLNGIIHVIIAEGLADDDFIAARTENYAALAEAVSGWTPERTAVATGLETGEIVAAARLFAGAERGMIVYSMGITQHSHGVDNVRCIAALAMLTGNVGRPGTGVNPLRGQNNVQGGCDMGALPDLYSGYQKVSDPLLREKFARAWGVATLPTEPGLPLTRAMDAASAGLLHGMFIMGENPMLSDPDQSHARRVLENLELLVVQDIFMTETAALADIVLPAACYAEKEGTFTNTERRVQR